jgi:hypothetical protein
VGDWLEWRGDKFYAAVFYAVWDFFIIQKKNFQIFCWE